MDQTYVCPRCYEILKESDGRLKCRFCGYEKPAPVAETEKILLEVAASELRLSHFIEAEERFLDAAKKCGGSALAYWGAFLARYGAHYEQDIDGKAIPTCNALSHISVYDNDSYKKAMSLATETERETFEAEAKTIEEIRKEWYEKASKQEPCDIFLCFKQSEDGKTNVKTEDYHKAYELYNLLTKWGYHVFFAPVSLRVGQRWEPYIYAALKSAKAMIVYASKAEYVSATWVKNEWNRYLKMVASGEKKKGSLAVVYDGLDPYELPTQLSRIQHIDRGIVDFSNVLSEYLRSIIGAEEKSTLAVRKPIGKTRAESRSFGAEYVPLSVDANVKLDVANQFLASRDFQSAQKRFEEFLRANPGHVEGELGLLLAKNESANVTECIRQNRCDAVEALCSIIAKFPKKKASELLNEIVEEADKQFPKPVSLAVFRAAIVYDDPSPQRYLTHVTSRLSLPRSYFNRSNAKDALMFLEAAAPYMKEEKVSYISYELGCIALEASLFDEAEDCFRACLVNDSSNPWVYWGLLLAKTHCRDDDALCQIQQSVDGFEEYERALVLSQGDFHQRVLSVPKKQREMAQRKADQRRRGKIQGLQTVVRIGVISILAVGVVTGITLGIYFGAVKPDQEYHEALKAENEKLVYAAKTPQFFNSGKSVKFGIYPTTHVSDQKLIAELEKQQLSSSEPYYHYDSGYYWKYEAAVFDAAYTFTDGTKIKKGESYWFRCEPINWRVLSKKNGQTLLLSEYVIDAWMYDDASNNYSTSAIRDWLIHEFYEYAFFLNYAPVVTTRVDNSETTTLRSGNPYVCEDTYDKVFLLCFADIVNTDYGFPHNEDASPERVALATDFALANAAAFEEGGVWWWTRTPYSEQSDLVKFVRAAGDLSFWRKVHYSNGGIRPAITIKA